MRAGPDTHRHCALRPAVMSEAAASGRPLADPYRNPTIPDTPAQEALRRYLSAAVPSFPGGPLEVFQFSHGQSNPTYLVKVRLERPMVSITGHSPAPTDTASMGWVQPLHA